MHETLPNRGAPSRFTRIGRCVATLGLLLPLCFAAPGHAESGHNMGITGRILKVSGAGILVAENMGNSQADRRIQIKGDAQVPVSGKKSKWLELRKGDFVSVSYREESGASRAVSVLVFSPKNHPMFAAALGKKTGKKRVFIGWIKQVDENQIVVRTPNAPPPSEKKGEAIKFIRQEDTAVESLRDSWNALEKGDRVQVHYGKGRPRPATRVVVLLRGGLKPLPPGLATRLYDPRFDRSVKDVDGIGEVPPGTPWPPPDSAQGDGTREGAS
jgi:hypothetical protein